MTLSCLSKKKRFRELMLAKPLIVFVDPQVATTTFRHGSPEGPSAKLLMGPVT